MARKKTVPADFGVVAISLEAQERHTSYGKLAATLTREEREKIVDKWKARLYG